MARRFIPFALFALPALTLSIGVAAASGPTLQARSYDVYGSPAPMEEAPMKGLDGYEGDVLLASRRGMAEPTITIDTENISLADLAASRSRGAEWLKGVQKNDGGWGAGSWGTDDPAAPSDVATTSMAILALVRDANGSDVHDDAINRAVRYVAAVVERSPADSARLDVPEGTQPQYKLGQTVDTHLAALMLGEVEGTFDDATNRIVSNAHQLVIGKVQMAQNSDGSFDSNGWAPVLSSSIAATSLDRAVQLGYDVDDEVLAKNDAYQKDKIDRDGNVDTSAGAGVDLYAAASALKGNREAEKRAPVSSPRAEEARVARQAAAGRVTGDSSGALFTGFGSAGGEEMLSYMMISDTLAEDGGKDWVQWEKKVGAYLVGTQNADGSWAGAHCITSRTFVTASAMMSLGAGDFAKVRASRDGVESGVRKASTDGIFAPDHSTVR